MDMYVYFLPKALPKVLQFIEISNKLIMALCLVIFFDVKTTTSIFFPNKNVTNH